MTASFQGKLTPNLEQQIVQLLVYSYATNNDVTAQAVPMQQQTGTTDYGLFSITAAVCACDIG